ncbi:MAG: TrkH family potassium uptake protein [Selenomonadaceae bacterium]|nr:TrkH family potassium uptake protein [Selenomonadaceae bacterium]
MNQPLMMYLLGRASVVMTASLLLPLARCAYDGWVGAGAFLVSFLLMGGASAVLVIEGRVHKRQLSVKDAAQFMFLFWMWLAFFGMLPFLCSGQMGLISALFESVSAVTTTGVSLLPAEAPYVMWFWRGVLSWLGGAAFLVTFVTVFPQVSGCFGMTLAFRRSMFFSSMLKPMDHLSVQILGVYACITLLSGILYALSGLEGLDPLLAAMLTTSTTGGKDVFNWFGEDGNPWPECTAALTMLLVCGNLLRYWRTFQRREFGDYYGNAEMKFFLSTVAVFGGFMTMHLWSSGLYDFPASMRQAFFHVLSFASTTGFSSSIISQWPDSERFFLFLLAFVGGCMGSPTGGLKAMRLIVLFKLVAIEVRRTLHPHMIANVVVGQESVPAKIMGRILSFFFLYMASFFLFVLVLSLSGSSLSEAVGMAASGFTSLGSSMGLIGKGAFLAMPDAIKIFACLFMLLARMEIFAFLLLGQLYFGEVRKKW